MSNDSRGIAVSIYALKKQGVRFNESNFPDADIADLDNHVMVFRDPLDKIFHR